VHGVTLRGRFHGFVSEVVKLHMEDMKKTVNIQGEFKNSDKISKEF